MERNTYTINLGTPKKAQHLLVNKEGCLDIKLKSKKEVLSEIVSICRKEYNCKECKTISLENDTNDNVVLDNGIVLINKLVENISNNYLVFLRLKYPIMFGRNNIKSDLIFTIFSPKNMDTFNRLQILSKLSRVLNVNNFREKIRGAVNAEDVIALFFTT